MDIQHLKQMTTKELHDAMHEMIKPGGHMASELAQMQNEHQRRLLVATESLNAITYDTWSRRITGDW